MNGSLLLSLKSASFGYGPKNVFKDYSIDIVRGEFLGAGKIAVFILLGVILLLLSFLYQKLKNVLFSDERDETEKEENG